MKPGQIQVFCNYRVLHGRGLFDPQTGSRHLHGCYMDWDMVESKRRALHAELHNDLRSKYEVDN